MHLREKVVLVTGAGTGIGRATAVEFAKKGCRVAINDVNEKNANQTRVLIENQGGLAKIYLCDVSDSEKVEAMVSDIVHTYGRIDVLVNNAAIADSDSPLTEISEQRWDRVIRVNLNGVFYCTKAAMLRMKQMGGGRIVNISSSAAVGGGTGDHAHYTASKAGVIGLTLAAAREGSRHSILVNCITPGAVNTPIIASETEAEMLRSATALNRLAEPQEIAEAINFIVEQDHMTGAILSIDAGIYLLDRPKVSHT